MTAMRVVFILVVLLGLGTVGFGQSGGAPRIYEVEFKDRVFVHQGVVFPGRRCPRIVPSGCGNGNSTGFSLTGRKGERFTVTVRSNEGRAIFSIFHTDLEVFENGSAVISWTGVLPASGDFRINVFTNIKFTPFTLIVRKD